MYKLQYKFNRKIDYSGYLIGAATEFKFDNKKNQPIDFIISIRRHK